MGCDIHFVVEKKTEAGWVGVASTDYGYKPEAKDRNYTFFGKLARVRGEGERDPIGLPRDPSVLSNILVDEWGSDGHSLSWMMMRDFVDTWFDSQYPIKPDEKRRQFAAYDALGVEAEDNEGTDISNKFRVIFLFDN